MRSVCGVLIGLLCLAGFAAAAHGNMTLTIPKALEAPTIDGKLSAGEWDDAAAITGMINQLDGVAHPRQAMFWLKYDDEHIYIAHRSTVLPQEREVRAPQLWLDRDSSIVVCLAPGRMGRGDEPSHYKLRVNINKQVRGKEITWKLRGVRVTYPHLSWDPKAKIESTIDDKTGVWQLEMAIPLSQMKVEKMEEMEQWGIFLARDYSWGDQNAITVSSDWRFGSGRRHYGRAFYNNYRLEKEYATARLTATDAVVQVIDLGKWREGVVQPAIAVKNTSDKPISVTASMDIDVAYGSGNQDPAQARVLNIKPGERVVHRFRQFGVPPGRHLLKMSVVGEDGTTYYRQDIPFNPGFGADRVEAVPDVYFQGYHFGIPPVRGGKVILPTVYNPIANKVYALIKIGDLPGKQKAARAEVIVRRGKAVQPLLRMKMLFEGREDVWKEQSIEVLLPGVYEAVATVYARDGAVLGRSRQTFIRYDHKKDLPWLGSDTGVSDEVLPPWTPLQTERTADGLKISPWGRTYHVGSRGLFTAIDTMSQSGVDAGARENILAAPMRVEMVQDGKSVTLTPDAAPKDVKIADHEASWKGALTGGGWRIETAVTMEYDGYALHRMRIKPPPAESDVSDKSDKTRLDRLRLVIPLKPRHATHLHATAGAWFRSSVSSITFSKDEGNLWHSGQSHGGPAFGPSGNGKGLVVGNFKPYVWIGGANRGLAFMADNDQGWVPDDTKKVPAIEVVREGNRVNLILNLVARPFTFDKAREVVFSLQATPIRPLEDNLRDRLERLHMTTAFPGFDKDGWCWNGSMLQIGKQRLIGGHGSQPYPLNWDRNIAKRKEWERRGHIFTPYQSQLNLMAFGEVSDPRMPQGKQASDVYGYIYPHMSAGCLEHGNLNIARPDLEYRLWCYQAWIKGCGLKGLYFDQTEPILGANLNAGCGYRIDLHDRPKLHGRVQPGYLLTNAREFYKRLRTLFVENGVDEPMIWLHTTDANMISAFAFVGAFLEGENKPMLTPDYPWVSVKLSPERMQAATNPAGKWGIGSVWLSMIAGSWNWPEARDKQYLTGRSMQGYARLHDYGDQWNYLSWAPFDRAKPMTFLPYWDPAVRAALKTDAPNILAGAYRQDNRLQVFVFNRSAETREGVQVRVDAATLGLRVQDDGALNATDLKGWSCKTELPMTWQAKGATGTLTVTIPPHDFRMILIAPADGAK